MEWGLKPFELAQLSPKERALMSAYLMVRGLRQEDSLQAAKAPTEPEDKLSPEMRALNKTHTEWAQKVAIINQYVNATRR